jgi:hypothetical protein
VVVGVVVVRTFKMMLAVAVVEVSVLTQVLLPLLERLIP